MRFVDANVFIYAYLTSKDVDKRTSEIKQKSKEIIKRINDGEEVSISVVHISEILNVLEGRLPLKDVKRFLDGLLGKDNVTVLPVTREDYLIAGEASIESGIGMNDALALILMSENHISEIYSFDRDFDKADVERIEK